MSAQAVHDLSDAMLRMQRSLLGLKAQVAAERSAMGDPVEWAAYGLLFHLVTSGPRRTSALAEAVHVDPSTVSRQVAQLVKAGLVERLADPEDGRASLLRATSQGLDVHADRVRHRHQLMTGLLSQWSSSDVAELTRLIDQFIDSVAAHRDTPSLEHS